MISNPSELASKKVLVLGAGGHANVLLDILLFQELPVLGFVTPDVGAFARLSSFPILGDDEAVSAFAPQDVVLVNGLGTIGVPGRRMTIFEKFKLLGYSFLTLVHHSAVVGRNVELKEGVQIMAGAVIQAGSCIGENSLINTRASVDHDCVVGKHVHIAPGATLSGSVSIGDFAHIGTGANLIQGVKVGQSCLVGAGALVIRDVESSQMVLGVPAKLAKVMKNWRKVLIQKEATIRQAIRVIDSEGLKIALVVGDDDFLLGTVTDGDVRRALLSNKGLESPVEQIMNPHPICVRENEGRDRLLRRMKEASIQQIPVVDKQGRVINLEILENLFLGKNEFPR
jgi:UDP-perosamine 4-acetyltransferase